MLKSPFAFLKILELLSPPEKAAPKGPHVAVVYASGAITSGKSRSDFAGNVSSMGSDTIVEALQQAGKDSNCKAVVLRVNSPGGSALASDMIWRAIQEVRKSKPVISSMGSVAASGGYWISMGCDAIVAQPSTITGSDMDLLDLERVEHEHGGLHREDRGEGEELALAAAEVGRVGIRP